MVHQHGLFITFLLSVMILAYKDITRFLPVPVTGVVLDGTTRKPLSRIHVFTRKGEEESFTNEQGVFRFTSWQQLPMEVTVQEPGGKEKKVQVSSTPVQLTVLFP